MQIAIVGTVSEKCIKWVQKHYPRTIEITDLDSADIVFSVFYNQIFTDKFIKRKIKVFNFHGGILPEYRGTGTLSWAIINGENYTGVTLHEIPNGGIDNGQIIQIRRIKILKNDTAEILYKKSSEIVFEMFKRNFKKLITQKYKVKPLGKPGKLYLRKDLQVVKDLTKYVRAFTFTGKENAYYFNKKGKKIELKWTD